MKVKKIPKVLEYYDANKDILGSDEGEYLELMDSFKEDYDTSKRYAESEKNHWKINMNFEEAVERVEQDIYFLNRMHRKYIEFVEEN
tara:strand:+ start:300 stop:560 length:261 start_codon:yes stop_codon:yes gene_type:complete